MVSLIIAVTTFLNVILIPLIASLFFKLVF